MKPNLHVLFDVSLLFQARKGQSKKLPDTSSIAAPRETLYGANVCVFLKVIEMLCGTKNYHLKTNTAVLQSKP